MRVILGVSRTVYMLPGCRYFPLFTAVFMGWCPGVSGQFCSKRLVGGKWISHGDCDIANPGIITDQLERVAELPTSCVGVTHEMIRPKYRTPKGGRLKIAVPEIGPKSLYCDVTTDGGGWTVFQRRVSWTRKFNQTWATYVNGFGIKRYSFWLGLEAIHQLTKDGFQELRVELIDKNGTEYVAKYRNFSVGSATSNYTLTLGGFSGNTTDCLGNQTRQQFSTSDVNNNVTNAHCARRSGWWFKTCFSCNLNGPYRMLYWDDEGGKKRETKLRYVEMKFRPRSSLNPPAT